MPGGRAGGRSQPCAFPSCQDGNGTVEFEEFNQYVTEREASMWSAYKVLDQKQSGARRLQGVSGRLFVFVRGGLGLIFRCQ